MVLGNGAFAHERGDHRNAEIFGQLDQLPGRIGEDHAPSHQHHRPLGLQKEPGGPVDRFGIPLHPGREAVRGRLGNLGHHRVGLDIHGKLDVHRPGPAAGGHLEGLLQHPRQLPDIGNLPGLFHHRTGHGGKIRPLVPFDRLESALPEHVGGAVRGEGDHRDRITAGRPQTDQGVYGPRADRGEDGQGLAGGAIIPIGEMHRGLLVPHRDQLDLIFLSQKGIQKSQNPVAGQTRHKGNALALQILDD